MLIMAKTKMYRPWRLQEWPQWLPPKLKSSWLTVTFLMKISSNYPSTRTLSYNP